MPLSVEQSIRKAKRFEKAGDIANAASLYNAVLEKFPNNARAQGGLVALKAQARSEAEARFAAPKADLDALVDLSERGHLDHVVAQADALAKRFPMSYELYNILGVAHAKKGRITDAIAAFNQALALKSDCLEAIWNLGEAFKRQGAKEKALACYENAVSKAPDNAKAHSALATAQAQFGLVDSAIDSFERALCIDPRCAETFYNRGLTLRKIERMDDAIKSFQKALSIEPEMAKALNALGVTLCSQGKLEEAAEKLFKAVEHKPDFAGAYSNLGNALKDLDRNDEAIDAYKKAISLNETLAEVHINLGNVYKSLGSKDEALTSYEQALIAQPNHARAHQYLSSVKRYSADDPQIDLMLQLAATDGLADNDSMHLHFGLGKAFDDIGAYDRAFAHFEKGNRARKAITRYSIERDQTLFQLIKDAHRTSAPPISSAVQNETRTPIFIVGMPRSGTSLVEQILASHSEVYGAGELDVLIRAIEAAGGVKEQMSEKAIARIGRFYRKELSAHMPARAFVTDKLPNNFRWVGIIRRALPEAKIVWVERDARAVCWSMYRLAFADLDNAYTDDFGDLIEYYRLYKDLMAYWMAEFPDAICRVDYEALTTSQKDNTRRLLAHIGLEWQDACLDFHQTKRVVETASSLQVKQKMYQGSSEEWRKYESFLQPLIDGLKEF